MDYTELGKSFKEWRLAHKIGLRRFAELLGIKPSRLSAFERGRIDKNGNIISLSDKELLNKIPVLITTTSGKPLTEKQLENLFQKIRRT